MAAVGREVVADSAGTTAKGPTTVAIVPDPVRRTGRVVVAVVTRHAGVATSSSSSGLTRLLRGAFTSPPCVTPLLMLGWHGHRSEIIRNEVLEIVAVKGNDVKLMCGNVYLLEEIWCEINTKLKPEYHHFLDVLCC